MNQTLPLLFADVIFPDRINRPFTYKIPATLSGRLKVGQWVVAPLGSQTLAGFILSLSKQLPRSWGSPASRNIAMREIQDVLTTSSDFELNSTLVDLARWMSDYYIAPLGICLQLIQPPRLPGTITSRISITEDGLAAVHTLRASTNAETLLTYLAKKPNGVTRNTLNHLVNNLAPLLNKLKRQGLIAETYSIRPLKVTLNKTKAPKALSKDAPPIVHKSKSDPVPLFAQSFSKPSSPSDRPSVHDFDPLPVWWDEFTRGLHLNEFQEFLVSAPWARDLNVFGQSVEETLKLGKSALLITPDISRASIIAQFLQRKWGDQVGLFHSDLSDTTKHEHWIAMSRGQVTVVVGTRLALFVPLPFLGLINLEDEHDPSYKDEQSPYYHAREVARRRAFLSGSTIFFQSPNPSVETFTRFKSSDHEFSLSSRSHKVGHPDIQVVDLRQTPYGTILSREMLEALESALKAGGGIVLYVNRKGFSSSLLCRDCGLGLECPHCHVALNMFKPPARLICTYCGYQDPVPVSCPACSSPRLEPAGLGTQRVEEELRNLFPTTTIARLDRSAIRTRQAHAAVCEQFSLGNIAMLVGTQLLFHGPPLAPVRLVGVPYAESGLHIPDFRAAEYLYQHLQQAVDLISTECEEGKVILQTRLPTHPSITAVAQQQPDVFYEHELTMRQAMGYPPVTQLIQLCVSGTPPARIQETAAQWGHRLTAKLADIPAAAPTPQETPDMILGPIPLRGHRPSHRQHYQILIKAQASMHVHRIVQDTLEILKADRSTKGIQFRINVDPVNML